jgi:hypothetical protein
MLSRKQAFLTRVLAGAVICCAISNSTRAFDLDAQLFPLSGEIRLHNPNNVTSTAFVYSSIYSITSHSGALNSSPSVWKSITGNYDLSGNGFIDPTHNWSKLSATSTELTEAVFTGSGGTLPAMRSVSLGSIWNPAVVAYTDIGFDVRKADSTQLSINIQRALEGDYDHNGAVNSLDYDVWRQNFGSTTTLDADGNINGVVDAADYVVWKKHNGDVLPGSGSVSGGGLVVGQVVPEPASANLILIGCIALLIGCVLARRSARPALARCTARR